MTEHVPSERFVMTVPSGRVTLAVEKLSTLPDPADDDEDDVAEVDGLLPFVVVEDTFPFPAVTVVDMSPEDVCPSTIVQVVPSSSLISSDAACVAAIRAAPQTAALIECLICASPVRGRRSRRRP